MHEETFPQPHPLGLQRLTGDNSGLFYTNERTVLIPDPETGEEVTHFQYDVYHIADARQKGRVKNDVIDSRHPFGDEHKLLRKTLARLLRDTGRYDLPEYADFRAYDQFAEQI